MIAYLISNEGLLLETVNVLPVKNQGKVVGFYHPEKQEVVSFKTMDNVGKGEVFFVTQNEYELGRKFKELEKVLEEYPDAEDFVSNFYKNKKERKEEMVFVTNKAYNITAGVFMDVLSYVPRNGNRKEVISEKDAVSKFGRKPVDQLKNGDLKNYSKLEQL